VSAALERVGRLAACAVAAALVATPVAAEPAPIAESLGYAVEVPAGWAFDVDRSNAISRGLGAERHYDGLRTNVGADAYVGDRASLFVQWIHARDKVDGGRALELVMRRTFDQIRARAAEGELVSWREDVREDLAEGNLEWSDPDGRVVTLVRAFVFATDDDRLRQVRVECVYSADKPGDRPRCEAALASLALTEATGPRGSIGAIPGAGTLRLSGDGDAPPSISVEAEPNGGAANEGGTDTAADGTDTAADADNGADRLVLDAPSLGPAGDASGDGAPPRVLYQAPKKGERGRDRTHQLITLIGAILVAAAVYAYLRERRRSPRRRDDSGGDDPDTDLRS